MASDSPTRTLDEVTGREKLVLHGPWRDEFQDLIGSDECTALEVNTAKGFVGDTSFLCTIEGIEQLAVIGAIDFPEELESKSSIQELSLSIPHVLPLTGYDQLKRLHLSDSSNQDVFLSNPPASLRSIYLDNYPYKDCVPLINLTMARELKLGTGRRLERLSGLSELTPLQTLGLYYATKLTSLAEVASLTSLEELEIYNCKRLTRIDPVANLQYLRRLLLVDCGDVESLELIGACKQLEELLFYGTTRIADGNLHVLKQLPLLSRLSFANRKGYSHRREEFAAYSQ